MAALTPSDKVKDKEYANWLKVTLALYHMKLGLHTFIKNEIDCLHQSLIQKIYGGPTIPPSLPPCTTCLASHVNRNKHTGVWVFRKQCKLYCDVWLYELLQLHTNPKSEKIYWDNSIVTAWRSNPWECAKVFMPRGQPSSNTGPADCDAQALLTLLANCNHFHFKLSPQGQGLINTISKIRNKIMHNGEMKLSDADRMKFIQEIIRFLEDPVSLKSIADCQVSVSNIHKIENDSLDIFFNLNDEMTALKAAVNEIRLELGMGKENALKTADALKEECKQLKEKLTRVDDIKMGLERHETRMDTIEIYVRQQVPRLDAKFKELKANTDTVLQQQEQKHQEMDTTVTHLSASIALHKTKLGEVEENLQEQGKTVTDLSSKLGTLEEKMQINMLTQWGNNSGRKRKVDGEGILDCDTEVPTKRRPESDGLRQLKNQTEDKLDTLRILECIPTTQAKEARKLLESKRSVVIKGNPGEGKTTTALHLIDNEMYRDRRVVLFDPEHWEKVDTDWVNIIILEDIFGRFDLDVDRLQKWMVHLPTIQEHVDAGKLWVIITTRVDIISKAYSKIGSLKLFSDDLSLTLSSAQLNHSEKMGILNRELRRQTKNMIEDRKVKCIANFRGLIGFPQCCSLFAMNSELFDRGPEFFKSPEKFFVENITGLEKTRFLALAFLFCNGEIFEEYLSSETMPESSKHLLMDLASNLNISKKMASITLLRDAYNSFLELYVVKTMSYPFEKPYICFTHATVCEAVGQVLGDHCLEMVVKHGNSEYLYQKTYTADVKDSTSQNVFIPEYVYGLLAERMIADVVEGGLVRSIVNHSALKQPEFMIKLKDELHKGSKIMDFLKTEVSLSGECRTFMQCILQCKEETVTLVYSHFLKFLACEHDTRLPSDGDVVQLLEFIVCSQKKNSCWQCKEKQELLNLALYYHHFQIADELLTMNAIYTNRSLCYVARHADLDRVQTILETLKRSQVFNPESENAKHALYIAYISGNQSLIEILLKEKITLDSHHVDNAAQHGDINILMKVVDHLKGHNKWNPHQEQHGTINATNELKLSMDLLVYVTKYNSRYDVAQVIQDLKVINLWDPKCEDAYNALVNAYRHQNYGLCDLLIQEEVSLTMKNLPDMVNHMPLESIMNVMQHWKQTDNWDPKCEDAYNALVNAYRHQNYGLCDLLIQEGVSLTMKNLPDMVNDMPLESIMNVMQHWKQTDNWDPKCEDASKALADAYRHNKYDVCDLLAQEGVSLTMKNLPDVVYSASLESIKKAIQHLKDTEKWDPKCDNASKALRNASLHQKYYVFDLLVQEGASLSMNNLPDMVYSASLESIKKAMQHLKNIANWDPKCEDASDALSNACIFQKYDVCKLLVQEEVSIRIDNLPAIVCSVLFESVKKAIQHLKDANIWDPKCEDVSKALICAYRHQKYDVCDLLAQEGVSLTMKNLPDIMVKSVSLESVKKAIQHLKDTNNWDPRCEDASELLKKAYYYLKDDVCDLLIQEGVSLTMKNLPYMGNSVSLQHVKKAILHLKDTSSWNSKCEDACEALNKAFIWKNYAVCLLLVQEGVSLTMKNLPDMVYSVSLAFIKKAIQHLKDTDSWDPKCEDASDAFCNASSHQKYDVCELLVQEGVSLTMDNLPDIVFSVSLESVKKAIQHLKETCNWDPKCEDASDALICAYRYQKYDICDLLVQEGVLLTMKNLPYMVDCASLESVKKAIELLKNTDNWDSNCDDASIAAANASCCKRREVFDLLVQEGVLKSKKLSYKMYLKCHLNMLNRNYRKHAEFD